MYTHVHTHKTQTLTTTVVTLYVYAQCVFKLLHVLCVYTKHICTKPLMYTCIMANGWIVTKQMILLHYTKKSSDMYTFRFKMMSINFTDDIPMQLDSMYTLYIMHDDYNTFLYRSFCNFLHAYILHAPYVSCYIQ